MILQVKTGRAQNLVPNPGFELISTCNAAGLMDAMENVIADWSTYNYADNSPDIFNECFTYPSIHLPNSTFGFSYANSGTGCAGFGANPLTNDYREVISNVLTEPLIADSAYCVSYFVKNSKGENLVYYSANLGLRFSQSPTNHNEVRQQGADIRPDQPVMGNEWTEISGYYIASGGEQFIHIGILGEPHIYELDPGGSGVIYYFIDDVSVVPCNKDSLLAVILELPNVITPNDDQINDTYEIRHHNIKTMQVVILDRWGVVVQEYDGLTNTWDGTDQNGTLVNDGVYFAKVVTESSFGEVFSKTQFVHVER